MISDGLRHDQVLDSSLCFEKPTVTYCDSTFTAQLVGIRRPLSGMIYAGSFGSSAGKTSMISTTLINFRTPFTIHYPLPIGEREPAPPNSSFIPKYVLPPTPPDPKKRLGTSRASPPTPCFDGPSQYKVESICGLIPGTVKPLALSMFDARSGRLRGLRGLRVYVVPRRTVRAGRGAGRWTYKRPCSEGR